VRRVSVVGTSGAGKSTFGAALAGVLGVSWVELDSVYHQADWTPLPLEEFRLRVAALASGPGWVIDGSYGAVRDLVWARADTVIWLDLPRRTVMRRLIWRTLRRIAGRVELWNGNRERWRNFFTWDDQESVLAWAWHTHGSRRERYAAQLADPANGHLRVVRLGSPRAVRRFLRATGRRAWLDLLRFSTEDRCLAEVKASNTAPKIPRGTEFPP
jgi:adenylate kinase family enzyme